MSDRSYVLGRDAHRVSKHLWVGSMPPPSLKGSRFHMHVMCALEDQRHRSVPVSIECPLIDVETPLDVESWTDALESARWVNKARRHGKDVLVTCFAGVNRSAFVAALAMVQSGKSPQDAILAIRERRKPRGGMMPLSNREFIRVLVEGYSH